MNKIIYLNCNLNELFSSFFVIQLSFPSLLYCNTWQFSPSRLRLLIKSAGVLVTGNAVLLEI